MQIARCALSLVVLFMASIAGCSPDSRQLPQVNTGRSEYSGFWSDDGDIAAFLGVPYARPPLAALRWAPPQAAVESAEFRTDRFAPACMQGDHLLRWYRNLISDFGADPLSFDAPEVSEDCLYLNIWTPSPGASTLLPVMVWIHGGSNKSGWSYEPDYHGEELAKRGVVVVSIAYRLGVFGFFSHPELEQTNFALLDQIAALRWLQRNIGHFGGDPQNITVFGESAGADDIGSLIVSPLARGLFRRAIHESGGSGILIQARPAELYPRAAALAAELGTDGSLAALRGQSAANVLSAADKAYAAYYFSPLIDGHSITEAPMRTLARADLPAVDLIVGTNANEMLMYLDADAAENELAQWLTENGFHDDVRLNAIVHESPNARLALDRLSTAKDFVCPSLSIATAVNRAGGKARVYRFTRQREGERGAAMGAYHGAEIPYVFDRHDSWLPTTATDRKLTETMGLYWTEFAKRGVPQPGWPVFELDKKSTQQLGASLDVIRHPDADLCRILMPEADWSDDDK